MLLWALKSVIEANDLCLECRDARGDTLPTIEDRRVIRLHAMPKVLASMEKTPCMNDHIKQFLRFTSEDELIRLAEIGLAVEMHQAAQRFLHGRTVPYTEETAAKLQAYLGSCSPKVPGTIQGDTQCCPERTHHEAS